LRGEEPERYNAGVRARTRVLLGGEGALIPQRGTPVSSGLPQKIIEQIQRAGLPTVGMHPFIPKLVRNARGEPVIEKRAVLKGPKQGKKGYVDTQDRIWVKDRSHSTVPDHWDVELAGGEDYFRVDLNGNEIP
jgi:hypothetical protein